MLNDQQTFDKVEAHPSGWLGAGMLWHVGRPGHISVYCYTTANDARASVIRLNTEARRNGEPEDFNLAPSMNPVMIEDNEDANLR